MKKYTITLIPGDGIGPEVVKATTEVIKAAGLEIDWEVVNAGKEIYEKTNELIPDSVYSSIEKNKLVLKGPITTPIGDGFRSINVSLRKKYQLYSNIRPIKSYKRLNKFDEKIDMIIFRENIEGLYIGHERKINENHAETIKKITRKGSERILRKAFQYAKDNKYEIVTVVHKANILKYTDGLFLKIAHEISNEYSLKINEVIIDNMCMQMVMNPSQFGVIVTMNLYGDILSDLGAGLVGGLGLIPGANIGDDIAIFEAVHGSAPDIAGKGVANPIALILSSAMMARYLGEDSVAEIIETSIEKVIEEGKVLTKDLGGKATTNEIKKEIIMKIKENI